MSKTLPDGFQTVLETFAGPLGIGVVTYNGRKGLTLRYLWTTREDPDTYLPTKKGIFIPFEAAPEALSLAAERVQQES